VTFLRGLLAARAHLAFLVGLALAFLTVAAVDRWSRLAPSGAADSAGAPLDAEAARALPLRPSAEALEPGERTLARAAWSYLERNTDPGTGLAAAVRGHPAVSLWDIGSQLMAIIAAEDLRLIRAAQASQRLLRVLRSLGRLALCDGRLPNKAYDVRTLEMTELDGRPAPAGTGWSALDVARVLAGVSLVAWRHPELAPAARDAVARWRLESLVNGTALRGASRGPDGALTMHDEGRLGYEHLAAKELLAWGLPVAPLVDPARHAVIARVEGLPVARDDRRPEDHGGARAPVVSEPWVLDGLENGFDAVTLPAARVLLLAQSRRFDATGRLTAASEDHLDRPPWFAYSAIVDGDETWTARGPDGAPAPGAFTFSTKAAVAWGVLFQGDYPDRLLRAAGELIVPGEGLLAGRYDEGGAPNRALSLNTNAVVLEALAYRIRGPARAAAPSTPAEARR